MSRIGKQLIVIPAGIDVKIDDKRITVKGPKGELTQDIHRLVKITQKDNQISISVKNQAEKRQKALWGLFKRLVENMIIGVKEGFSKKLEVNGVGYKAVAQGKKLVLNVGYSHPVEYDLSEGVEAGVEKNIITISGTDKQLVGQTAAEIRSIRKPEPYKGKGIKYIDEVIIRKTGKAAAKAE
ncbi:MAG: 50S ribosomal protein L6 [Candidatus Buchananbacteria bacterium RIFCSPHIGHO2_02_FULL_38_8]|uniref:Large ribosomal subunit protein uL6 n=1 Tax=Candidatus Buchananbacteria bacterium RIFCSPHIGHO2_02_FULL_38_8 TaxID=1797538 RepID=A0A1G1Y5S6_9BACT|nr:MAG: 50S ribosomal protein L6 [Candidatus Buchananbacteria bacterium RIFCSPHIGHO2_02_FULL_38_8]